MIYDLIAIVAGIIIVAGLLGYALLIYSFYVVAKS